jgi:uridylate kinase
MSKRILLKLSGETLSGKDDSIDVSSLEAVVFEIKEALKDNPVELAIVIGAGNIWRGAKKTINRVEADKIGMLATVMNSLALKAAFNAVGLKSQVFGPVSISSFIKDFDNNAVIECLEKGNIVILAGGTGSPFFTTDTGASLRAAEIKADIILKATQVDGVYSADPKKDSKAIKYDRLTFEEALTKKLQIMDVEAFSMCRRENISIRVFNFHEKLNLKKILNGENIGTLVSNN